MKALFLVVLAGLLAGCGPTAAELRAYYDAVDKQNEALIKSIEGQGEANKAYRAQQAQYFSQAMERAAATPSPTDDVVISFAWGYQSAAPFTITTPELQKIEAPETSGEKARAYASLLNVFAPYLHPLLYGLSANDNTSYELNASEGSTILFDSANVGSKNSAGGDQAIIAAPADSDIIDNSSSLELDINEP